MTRRALTYLCAALVCAAPFLYSSTSWAAATTVKTEVAPSKEAWYAETPPCVAFFDCSALPPSSPYPEDTLHVALTGGQETARTYLSFELLLPLGAKLQEGVLTLPVDPDPSHGSVSPETADFLACLTTPKFKAARGSLEKPPKANCDVHKAAVYSEKRVSFAVDLDSFIEKWDSDEVALALVPSPKSQQTQESWHVVFPATAGDTEDAPEPETQKRREITATLKYSVEQDSADTIGTDFDLGTGTTGTDTSSTSGGGTSTDFSSSSGPSFDQSTSLGGGSTGTDVPTASDPTEALAPEATQPIASFTEGFAGPGFAYPIIWALPLIVLLGLGSIGRALTKDLYRADE